MQSLPDRPAWLAMYVAVDDVEKALVGAEELGGRRLLPDRSRSRAARPLVALFADPDGNVIGLFEVRPPATAPNGEPRATSGHGRRHRTAAATRTRCPSTATVPAGAWASP